MASTKRLSSSVEGLASLRQLSREALRQRCEAAGVPTKGTKEVLIARLAKDVAIADVSPIPSVHKRQPRPTRRYGDENNSSGNSEVVRTENAPRANSLTNRTENPKKRTIPVTQVSGKQKISHRNTLLGQVDAHSDSDSVHFSNECNSGDGVVGVGGEVEGVEDGLVGVTPVFDAAQVSWGTHEEAILPTRGVHTLQSASPAPHCSAAAAQPPASHPAPSFSLSFQTIKDAVREVLREGTTIGQGEVTSTASAMVNMPAVPEKLHNLVKDGKYLDFDLLLSSVAGDPSKLGFQLSLLPQAGDAPPIVQYLPKQDSKHRVVDMPTWLRAWTIYMEMMTYFHPHLTIKLVLYQGIVVRFSRTFHIGAWILYDRLFRQKLAHTPCPSLGQGG